MYVLFSGILLAWELVGVDLPKEPFEAVKITLKSPDAAPLVFLALIAYFGFHSTVEWFQCDPARRAQLPSLIDFTSAHAIAACALLVFGFQAATRVQIFDYVTLDHVRHVSVGTLLAFALTVAYSFRRRWVRGQARIAMLAVVVVPSVFSAGIMLLNHPLRHPADWVSTMLGIVLGCIAHAAGILVGGPARRSNAREGSQSS